MDLANTIALTPEQRQIVLALVQKHLPDTTVWAYGSRVKGTARPHSDLDLAAFATPQQQAAIADLQEAFDESDLPFRVDLLVWHELPEQFHQTIAADYVVVQQGLGCNCQTAVPA